MQEGVCGFCTFSAGAQCHKIVQTGSSGDWGMAVLTGPSALEINNPTPSPKNTQFQNGRQKKVSVRVYMLCHLWIMTLLLSSALVICTEGVNSQLMGQHQEAKSYPIHSRAKNHLSDLPKMS